MRRLGVVMVALVLVVAVAACSDDREAPPSAAPSTTAATDAAFASGTASQGAPPSRAFDPAASLRDGDPLVVRTAEGPVRGELAEQVRQFHAVPYAAAPVGPRRFAPPQPVEPWTEPRDATGRAPQCTQTLPVVNLTTGQEDCLYLDVTAPAQPPAQLAPVMVWIHGGGFTVGSLNDDPPTRLVERSGVVVVSINYRLGPFGFLALDRLAVEDPGHSIGNMGFLDQVAALRWVQRSIAAFGGDPRNVTLFGESAGGMSICGHLYSPRSSGLFHRAVMQSGPCERGGVDRDAALAQGSKLAATLRCDTSPDVVACLRGVAPETLLHALPGDPTFLFLRAAFWMPTADGVTLPGDLREARSRGRFNHVPVLAGVTRDEGRLFFGMAAYSQGARIPVMTATDYATRVEAYFGQALGRQVVERYPLSGFPDPGAAFGQAVGDAILACPALDGALALGDAVPVHLYQYEHAPNPFVLPLKGIDLGAFHSSELAYLFGVPVSTSGAIEFSPDERALSDLMIDAWTRFARTGDPASDAVAWPEAGDDRTFRVLDLDGRVASGLRRELCEFWRRSGFDPAQAGRQ